jgi:hypothetical protein
MTNWTTSAIRLGIVVDVRSGPSTIGMLPAIVSSAGLGEIWLSDRAPTGPLPAATVEEITAVAGTLGLEVLSDRSSPEWTGGPHSEGDRARTSKLLPCWPGRDLDLLLVEWGRDRGAADQLVVELPVSIGRTRAEAAARATTWFSEIGDPQMHGLYGTLEECQDRVAELAAVGVSALACVLPEHDVADVIAQLSAVRVSSSSRPPSGIGSPAPMPPAGWGSPTRRRR